MPCFREKQKKKCLKWVLENEKGGKILIRRVWSLCAHANAFHHTHIHAVWANEQMTIARRKVERTQRASRGLTDDTLPQSLQDNPQENQWRTKRVKNYFCGLFSLGEQSNENNRTRLGIDRIISIHIFNVVVKHFHFALHATCLFWSVGLNRGRIVAQHCRRDVHCPVELAFQ